MNISWTEIEGIPAISYFKLSTYRFDPALSVGDPKTDKITTANLPILVRNSHYLNYLGKLYLMLVRADLLC